MGVKKEQENRESSISYMMGLLEECDGDYKEIHGMLRKKRLAWWETNKDKLRLQGPLPKQAYQLVILEYLRIDPEEAPVIYDSGTRITWLSFNFCPVIEACERLGLDTAVVCEEGFEESVQDLISQLDPRLKFSRNYLNGIRPQADYCEETIELVE